MSGLLSLTRERALPGAHLPTHFKKLQATAFSTEFREAAEVVEVPLPTLGPGEALCRVLYAGVNASDRLKTNGFYGDTELPFDLGIEAVAQIVAVGPGVPGGMLGKFRILADTGATAGMYAEYAVANVITGRAIPVPSGKPKYAAVVVTGMSVATCMATNCKPKKGQSFLVTAAAGSGGTFAVQLGKQRGAHVIGTCGSADKAEMLRRIGCERVINYREEDVADVLSREYPDGIDWVLENVGGVMLDACIEHLAHRGTIVSFGFVSEHGEQKVPMGSIGRRLIQKSGTIRGFAMEHNLRRAMIPGGRLIRAVARRQIEAVVDPTEFRGLEAVVDAVEHHNAGKNVGKVVVHLADPV